MYFQLATFIWCRLKTYRAISLINDDRLLHHAVNADHPAARNWRVIHIRQSAMMISRISLVQYVHHDLITIGEVEKFVHGMIAKEEQVSQGIYVGCQIH